MRKRWWLVGTGGVFLAVAAVLLLVFWPKPMPGNVETAQELGYFVDYEFDPDTLHIHQSNPDRAGQEYVGVVVQGHYSVMILDGNITLNRAPFGVVKKGDRIKVSLDKRMWVNGAERKSQSGG